MLTLNVISCRGLPPPEATSVSFDRTNGTIGRAVDNDLVLPDPENFISRHHAKILYEDGIYILADTSLSGTVIDDGEPLKKRSAELCDGMRIYIGDYELGVEIREGSGQGPFPEDYSESDMLTDILARPGPSTVDRTEKDPGKFPRFADSSSSGEFPREPDPYAVFDDEAPLDSDSLAPLESKSPLLDSFEPPLAGYKPAAADIPEEFDLEDLFGNRDSAGPDESPEASPRSGDTDRPPIDEAFDFDLPEESSSQSAADQKMAKPRTEEAPAGQTPAQFAGPSSEMAPAQSRPKTASAIPVTGRPVSAGSELQANQLKQVLFQAMGLERSDFLDGVPEEDTVRLIGTMFRDLIEGLMTLLRSRAELKNQFRVSVTTIRQAENNPLKFTVTVPDALNAMLRPGQRGYLKPLDAIQNGFNDVSNHQLAMTAGIRAALTELLERFNPDRFEKKIEGGFFKNKNAQCWEAYSKAYEQLVAQAVDDFFGDAFVNAYEKQIQELESFHVSR